MSRNSANELPSLRSHVSLLDIIRIGSSGLRSRRLRSLLSALGITIGIAALIGVLGLSASGSAALNKQLDALGTNLLTVEAGEGFRTGEAKLPEDAANMIKRITPVYEVATVSKVPGKVLRNDLVDDGRTRGITIIAADLNLIKTQRGSLAKGVYLTKITSSFPTAVLGAITAERLGINDIILKPKLWIDEEWFTVIGILNPLPLAADLDRSVIIGYESAHKFLDHEHNNQPDTIYIRAYPDHILDVRSVMAATVNPEKPEEVQVSRASDVLEAKAAAQSTFTNLFVGLGTVALLVGGIGIANVMVIAVIERRNEIGLRRALGATRFHIGTQFLTESLLLASLGGIAGVVLGISVTAVYTVTQAWTLVIPAYVIFGGIATSLLIGGLAGFYPAISAANMSPTDALRTR